MVLVLKENMFRLTHMIQGMYDAVFIYTQPYMYVKFDIKGISCQGFKRVLRWIWIKIEKNEYVAKGYISNVVLSIPN